MNVHVFVGPTLSAARINAIDPRMNIHPPAAHGDVLRLRRRAGDVVVVIDGVYHQTAPVRHKEILHLMAEQVVVIGCASMGALRAAELAPFGMIGNGTVFQMYRSGEIEADDEVSVAHGDGPEYRRFSEPLVNIRCAVAAARQAGVVSESEAAMLIAVARSLPYTSRTWRAIENGLPAEPTGEGSPVARIRSFLGECPDRANVKEADAIDTLARIEELVESGTRANTTWTASAEWRNRHLYEWTATFTGEPVEDVWVGHAQVARYRQIYDAGFPRRWRRFVLHQLLSAHGRPTRGLTEAAVEAEAVALARTKGLRAELLTREQLDRWVPTADERGLPSQELVCRILVRSYRAPRGVYDLLAAELDLAHDDQARRAVAESILVNATVATWGPSRNAGNIKTSALRSHLVATWELATDDTGVLTTAARDRGFAGLTGALETARSFYLRHHLEALRRTERVGL